MLPTRSRFCLAAAFTGLFVSACGGGDGDAAKSGAPSSPATSAPATASAPATPATARIPGDCADETLTVPLAPLIKGKPRGSSSAKKDQLLCSWGKALPLVTVTIGLPSAAGTDTSSPVVDVPELKRFGAVARAKATQIAAGSKKLFISSFVVTSDRYRISVAYTGEERRDQEVGDAAVAITQRLHTAP